MQDKGEEQTATVSFRSTGTHAKSTYLSSFALFVHLYFPVILLDRDKSASFTFNIFNPSFSVFMLFSFYEGNMRIAAHTYQEQTRSSLYILAPSAGNKLKSQVAPPVYLC